MRAFRGRFFEESDVKINHRDTKRVMSFENLPVIEGILQFLQLSLTQGSSTARRAFRQWVREALAK